MLSGLLDTDGSVDKDIVRLFNTNLTIADGITEYLDDLEVGYSRITLSKGKNKPLEVIAIKAEDLPRSRFDLQIGYKRERYLKLKDRSRGRRIELGEFWFMENRSLLKRLFPKTTINRRFRNRWFWLLEDELSKVNTAKAEV